MVARAPIPTAFILRRPNLHQSVRHVSTQEHMPMSASTDVRVNVLGKVLRPSAHPNSEESRQSKDFFECHICNFIFVILLLLVGFV